MVDRATFRTLHEGNTFVLPFLLRVAGSKEFWDVSGSTKIQLEMQHGKGANAVKFVVLADPDHPNADWLNGAVPVQVGPADLTSLVGTWACALSIFIGSEAISLPHDGAFLIEVVARPAFP